MADEVSVTLGDVDIALAWNVRGDAAQPAFVDATGSVLGLSLPLQPNTSARADGKALLWLGPRSWLYVVMGDAAHDDFDAARKAINASGGALFDVSSSYVAWTIAGEASVRVLNRGCPLDLHPAAFGPGCGTVSLELYSEKAPDRADTRVVPPATLQQIWRDFGLQ